MIPPWHECTHINAGKIDARIKKTYVNNNLQSLIVGFEVHKCYINDHSVKFMTVTDGEIFCGKYCDYAVSWLRLPDPGLIGVVINETSIDGY